MDNENANAFETESFTKFILFIIGTGDYYSSGNDLSNFMNINMDDIPKMAKDGRYLLL